MNRSRLAQIGQETVEIAERGHYRLPDGRGVHIAPAVQACKDATRLYTRAQLERLVGEVLARPVGPGRAKIELRNETTLEGISRVLALGEGPVTALNFASAKNPGGGFLGGSRAQEESLARSSALYGSLLCAPEYYAQHRRGGSCLYTDTMILSPGCPVFRNDAGDLLETPAEATFVTSAAPNAGAITRNSRHELDAIPSVFRRRIEYVLALAAEASAPNLILGAWGCGAFRNDSTLVADIFAEHIRGPWACRFRRIVFSVLDTSASQNIFHAFREALRR